MRQIAAFFQRAPYHEHPEQKEHYIEVDGLYCIQGRYLEGQQDGDSAEQHYLPQLESYPSDSSDSNEEENNEEDDYRDHSSLDVASLDYETILTLSYSLSRKLLLCCSEMLQLIC